MSNTTLTTRVSGRMQGAPIQGAMRAARAFLAQRSAKVPVAVVVFGPDDSVLTDFTKSREELAAAVSSAPPLAEGTHIYDALVRVSDLAKDAGLERTTVVLLSDGTDVGSDASRAEALEALDDANVRVISVGLRSKQYNPDALKSIAANTGGTYSESASAAALGPIFARISSRLSSEYTLRYTSLLPPETKALVKAHVAGFPAATATYTSPKLALPALGSLDPRLGSFDKGWIDQVILSPFLMSEISAAGTHP